MRILKAEQVDLIQFTVNNYNRISKKHQYVAEEVQVEHLPNTRYSAQKLCYNNAFRYILMEDLKARYVLGFVVYRGLPMEHAWIEKDGKYYDPTLDPTKYDRYVRVIDFALKDIGGFVSREHHPPALIDTLKL